MAKLYKRGDVWYSNIRIGGKRIRKPLSSNKQIAESKLGDLVKQRNAAKHGHAPVNAPWPTFRDDLIKASQVKKKRQTWMAELRAFRELEKVVQIQRIGQITPELLEEVVKPAWILAKRGRHVINRDLRSIRTAMKKAEDYGYVPIQKWTANKYLKVPKGRLHFFEVKDLFELKKVCHGIWLTVLYLGARAGLRPGEMRALPWHEVDFERNRIHIVYNDEWEPKDYERRYIPMAKDLRDYLQDLHASRKANEFVIQDKNGERPSLPSMSAYFPRLIRKAKLKGSLYTLRHTFGAHAASAGVPPKVLQKWLGHSEIDTTDIYMHVIASADDDAIQRLPIALN